MAALASAALFVGAPALAQHGGGHGGGHGDGQGGGVAGGMAGGGSMGGNGGLGGSRGGFESGVDIRNGARMDSEGPSHADARALGRANENSVLHRGADADEAADRDDMLSDTRDLDRRAVARQHSQGPAHADINGMTHADADSVLRTRTSVSGSATMTTNHGRTNRVLARANSQGAVHANARALNRANANSALSTSTTASMRHHRMRHRHR